WSISPLGRAPERTAGNLPIGFEDDTAYFEPAERWVLGRLMAAPAALRDAPDLATCRYVTWRHLLQGRGPGLVSVWHPSFLTLLVEAARAEPDRLLHDLRHGALSPPEPLPLALHARLSQGLVPDPARAEALAARLREGPWRGCDLLPDLALISCWTEGAAARALPALQALFPGVEVQGKGLLATEGVVSVPLLGHPGALPALTSHFLEFVPVDDAGARPRLVDALEDGASYEVLLTTGGGLYRYALRDVVEVVGRLGRVPLLGFRGRAGLVSDLVGEKLAAVFVEGVLGRVLTAHALGGRFAMLAPAGVEAPPGYELYVAGTLDHEGVERLTVALELGLRENPHYAYARALGQLRAARVVPVGADAEARYVAGCVALGQRAGDVKPTPLHRVAGWRERLVGAASP
ncbi:MAG: GH3 auxin-responsive promoter family protein, partial [Candidatus Sericytochromatia bacterium]|nr:GH3 auxin-responsive promoter family protein [Candidatus Sericytochromatia bacterium]